MPKALCYIGITIAGLLLLLFGLDLGAEIPFNRISMPMDIGMVVACLIVIYGAWSTLRELK